MQASNLICQIVIAALLLSCQRTTAAQGDKTGKEEPGGGDKFQVVEHYPLILIDALVVSRGAGMPVSDFTHRDFVISENGTRQNIAIWERGNVPLSLLVLVDAPSSRDESHVVDNQIRSLKSSLVTYLGTEDKASVVVIAADSGGNRPPIPI